MLKSQIPVDPKVMRHLDYLGLGMEKKKVERERKLRLYRRWVSDGNIWHGCLESIFEHIILFMPTPSRLHLAARGMS